jgi:hypothetical protein
MVRYTVNAIKQTDSLAIFDGLRLYWWQLLELTTFAVGHFQGGPQTMSAIRAVLSVALEVIVS